MISKTDIEDLARLARLDLSETEKEALIKDFEGILEYVGQVAAVSGDVNQKPIPPLRNVMRDDALYGADVPTTGKQEALLAALPKREGDYAVVRKIIQKEA